MKHRYIINIAGNDTFSWNKEDKVINFEKAAEWALLYLAALQDTTIEQLRITSITELPS